MTQQPEANNLDHLPETEIPEALTAPSKVSTRTGFALGVAAGSFIAAVIVLFSLEMSPTGLADIQLSRISAVQWAAVLAMPLTFGVLGAKFKHQFFEALESMFPVPF